MSYIPYGDIRTDYLNSCPADFQSGIDSEEWNEDLVDITSYVPLDLRLKQLERAGVRARLRSTEFSISELRQIYDNHELEYNADDDLEDVLDKETKRRELIAQILKSKQSSVEPDSPPVKDESKMKDVSGSEPTEG